MAWQLLHLYTQYASTLSKTFLHFDEQFSHLGPWTLTGHTHKHEKTSCLFDKYFRMGAICPWRYRDTENNFFRKSLHTLSQLALDCLPKYFVKNATWFFFFFLRIDRFAAGECDTSDGLTWLSLDLCVSSRKSILPFWRCSSRERFASVRERERERPRVKSWSLYFVHWVYFYDTLILTYSPATEYKRPGEQRSHCHRHLHQPRPDCRAIMQISTDPMSTSIHISNPPITSLHLQKSSHFRNHRHCIYPSQHHLQRLEISR